MWADAKDGFESSLSFKLWNHHTVLIKHTVIWILSQFNLYHGELQSSDSVSILRNENYSMLNTINVLYVGCKERVSRMCVCVCDGEGEV